MADLMISKVKREHLTRFAFLYVRQSTLRQVHENTESTMRQYALSKRLVSMGWDAVMIKTIDCDLGQSGSGSEGRRGFQHLVSEVSLGRAGIVAGIEVSRLSRSSSDWGRLLQIAALSNTLIMDEDGVYDVNDFNDRLLLGLKGTLSEVELHYLSARMRGALLNKAKRGELKRALPAGYFYDEDGRISKDPDAQVRDAVSLFFNTFARVGSAGALVREYERQGFLFPRRQFMGFRLGGISWRKIDLALALRTLKSPFYAGIYAYGQTQTKHSVGGRKKVVMQREQYHAWLPGSHPAYISEAQFDENNRKLEANSPPRPGSEHGGAVREGSALLQGIALCGKCGRKMTVRYSRSGKASWPIYMCEHDRMHFGGKVCQSVAGGNIDTAIDSLILEAINPLTVDAAISIQREMDERKEEILRLYSQRLERARHEMDLAKRRYLLVDPDNRLVAAELEGDWNQKAIAFELEKTDYEQKCGMKIRAVDDDLKHSLSRLCSDLPKIWGDPSTSTKEKKRVVRLVLEDVTITADKQDITLGIRFKGGSTRVMEIPRKRCNLNSVVVESELAAKVKDLLLLDLTYSGIARALDEQGIKNGLHGKPFTVDAIRWVIVKFGLPTRSDICIPRSDGWLTAKEKMAELGVDKHKLYRLRNSGAVTYKKSSFRGSSYHYEPEVVQGSVAAD